MTSHEFVKQTILDGLTVFDYTTEEIDNAQILPGDHYIEPRKRTANFSDTSYMNITIRYTPENNFDCFSSVTSEHDGTLLFFLQDLQDLVTKIVTGRTVFEPKARKSGIYEEPGAFDIEMEFGDIIVITSERTITNQFGHSFHGLRTSCCVPIKWDCHRRS